MILGRNGPARPPAPYPRRPARCRPWRRYCRPASPTPAGPGHEACLRACSPKASPTSSSATVLETAWSAATLALGRWDWEGPDDEATPWPPWQMGLESFATRQVPTLSGGERQLRHCHPARPAATPASAR